jgi:VCBS repeat-containing protein
VAGDNGVHTFSNGVTFVTAGSQSVKATDTATSSITGTSNAITVSAAAATHYTVSAPSSAANGFPFNFTVTARDQFNNTATSYTGTVHFGSSDGAANLPADSMLTNGTGTFSATLNTNGNQTITATDTVTASITGTSGTIAVAIDHPPVANNDSFTAHKNLALMVPAPGVLANDTDADGDALTAVLVSDPAHGSLALSSNGSFTYTPAAGYTGPDSFTYQANDGIVLSNVATVSLTVVNDPPVAVNDAYMGHKNLMLTVSAAPGVLANDTDADGDALTAVLVSGPAHGSLTLSASGALTYTPAAGYTGPDNFTYKANDGQLDSNVATVSLTVVNDPPVAVNDSYTAHKNLALMVAAAGVLANDTDPNGDPLTAVLVSGPAHGSLALNADGSFTYTPAAGYTGPDSFTYQASDGALQSYVATVSLTVVNDAPVAVNDSFTAHKNIALTVAAAGVLANDTDPNGDALSAVLVSGPAHGSLASNADGSFTYTPAAGFTGPDSFTYQANDGQLLSNVATVSLTVVNDPPVAVNDSYTAHKNIALTVPAAGVLANDTDPNGDALSAVLVSGPSHGTLALSGNGGFTYTPAADYAGPDSFTYKANDGSLDSNVATVSLTVVNDAPVAVNDTYSTAVGNTELRVGLAAGSTPAVLVSGSVLGNDTDANGDSLTAVLVSGPAHGSLTLNANGSFTYTPAAGYTGADSFTYKANDGSLDSNVATVSITLTNKVWYIDSSAATNGDGRSNSPFNSLTNFNAVNDGAAGHPANNDNVYLAAGSGTYNELNGIVLHDGQILTGAGVAFTLGGLSIAQGTRPVIANSGIAGGNDTGITLGSGNTVRGLNVGDTDATDISGTAVGTLTINNVALTGTGRGLVVSTGGTLAATFDSITSTSSTGGAVVALTGVGGSLTVSNTNGIAVDTSISNAAAGISIAAAAAGASFSFGDTSIGSSGTGVNLSGNNASATTSFASLAITTTAGAGLSASNGGSVSVSGTGNTIGATGGTAVNLVGTPIGGGGMTFSTVSTSGAANGIVLDTVGNVSFTANGGSLAGVTTRGVDINAGGGNFTYAGTITTSGTSARSVEVTNHTGGTVAFSGAITDSSLGINLTNNTNATINFSGGLAVSTGANAAFTATGGGTVTATQNNGTIVNTLSTSTGTALNVANTTIGASGLTFRSINSTSSGSNSAIILNTTGSSGGLTVSGNSTAGSGGTISGKTVDAVSLTSTSGVSLNLMNINNNSVNGILGNTVTDLTLNGLSMSNNGSIAGQDGVNITNLLGTSGITNTTISASAEDNVNIVNNSGTLTLLTVSGSTFSNTRLTAVGNDGFLFIAHNSAVATILVTGGTAFTNNALVGAQFQALDSSNVTVTVQGSTFTDNNSGLQIESNSGAHMTATIGGTTAALGNTFSVSPALGAAGSAGDAITATNFAASTSTSDLRVKILHNNITVPSGGVNHAVIIFGSGTNAPLEAQLDSNTITNNGQFDGIHVNTPDTGTTPAMNVIVTNNNVNSTDAADGTNAINLNYRRAGTAVFKVEGNTTAAPGGFGIQLRQTAGTVSLERGSSASNAPATVLTANNPSAVGGVANISVVGTVTVVNNGTVIFPMLAAPGALGAAHASPLTADGRLTPDSLTPIVAEAVRRWAATGLTAAQIAELNGVRYVVQDLPGDYLGETALHGSTVSIDVDAAGYGWYIDPTPADDSEFAGHAADTRLYTDPVDVAAGRMDLLTVVMHELGHVLGLDSAFTPADQDGVMFGYLTPGERLLPAAGDALAVPATAIPESPPQTANRLSVPVVLGRDASAPAAPAVAAFSSRAGTSDTLYWWDLLPELRRARQRGTFAMITDWTAAD